MSLSLKPSHLRRYRDIAVLLLRYGDQDLINTADLDESLLLETDEALQRDDGKPEAFAADLERLGPTFIKLGQLLSTRPDILPIAYTTALARLQDDVVPIDYEEVDAIVQTELGVKITTAFARFETAPLAAASLAQVHRAALRDGREVAVKVQRPGIREQIFNDLEALAEVVAVAAKHSDIGRRFAVNDLLDEFRSALIRELDFRLEAQNLERLRHNLSRYSRLVVPRPVADYSTSRVLTMEFINGVPVTGMGPLRRLELEGDALAEDLVRAYLDQILVDGFFHADPHPGNILITEDNRLALLDLGMVARLSPERREQLLKLLLAMTQGRGHDAAVQAIYMGKTLPDFDEEGFKITVEKLLTRHLDDEMRDVNVGRLLLEVLRASAENGLQPPRSLALLGKALLNLDEISRTLAPGMRPREIVRKHAASVMQRQVAQSLAPTNVFSSMLESQQLARALPPRLNTITEKLAEDRFTVRLEALDERHAMENLHRMVNRLSLAVVLAALIVGAAMLMQVDTDFEVLGYPGLAMILFVAAVACGFTLIISIFLGQRSDNNHPL